MSQPWLSFERSFEKKKGMYFFHFLYKKEKNTFYALKRKLYFFTNPPKIIKLNNKSENRTNPATETSFISNNESSQT